MLFNNLFRGFLFSLLLTGCLESEQTKAIISQPVLEAKQVAEKESQPIDYNSVELKLLDISEREVDISNAIVLLFNAPLQADQKFSRYIEITPNLASPVLSEDGKQLQFHGISPETSYEIKIVAGLKAQHNSQLQKEIRQVIKTRAMLPIVSFKAKKGAILVPGYSDSLGIYSVNVSEADLNIYRVKSDQLARFLEDYSYIATSGAYQYRNSEREKVVEHLYTARIETGGKPNQRHITTFPITGEKWADKNWANESGVYFATLGKPGSFEFEAATWFSVSAIGLQVRKFPKQTHIITQDIHTGKPLQEIEIELLDSKSQRYAQYTSDEKGVVKVNTSNRLSLIIARKGKEVTVLPYQNPKFDLSDFNIGNLPHSESQLFVYSERDIYRPGETLTLSILRRGADGQVQSDLISIELFKPDGSSYKSIWLKASDIENGYYQYSVDLPKLSPVGNWQAKVNVKGNSQYDARFHFKVEDFLPERLRLTLGEENKLQSFSVKQGLAVNVLGEYLYGAPASGNRLETKVDISAWSQPFKQWPDYYVGDANQVQRKNFVLPEVKLDDAGKFVSKVDQQWDSWKTPTKVRLYYSLFESGGRAINRHYDSLLWPKKSFVAVKPVFENHQSSSNSTIHFNLLKLDKEGQTIRQGNVKVALVREEKRYFWTYNNNNGWHYERIEKEYVVDNRTLTFIDQMPLALSQMVEWGDYRLELTDLETQGQTIYRFRAGEPWYNDWQNNSTTIRPDRVNLALDKVSYLPNEQLILRIASPHAGNALITIEADKVLYQQQVELDSGKSEVTLTLPKALSRHDLYITTFVIAPSRNHSESVAKRSFGLIHLPLTRSDRVIDLTLDVVERWAPNQQVIAKIIAKDARGVPLSGNAKVTLAAVDAGALSITGYKVENPHAFFYGQRAYQGAITDIYDQVMTPLIADNAKIRWGGDATLTRGGEKAESEVQIVSLFSGLVNIKEGVAEIPLQLPAFDGELQLTAIAFGNSMVGESMFGKAEQSVKVASPVVLQAALPKFMASGDVSEVSLDLTNVTDQTLTGDFSFIASGTLLAQNIKQSVTLEPNQKQTLRFNLTSQQDIGVAEIKTQLLLADETINRNWSLPVRATQATEFHSEKALLMPGDSLSLPDSALTPFTDATQQLQLSIGLSPNLDSTAHWDYLTQYPYGCLEQTTSKSRPFAAVLSSNGTSTNIDDVSVKSVQQKAQGAIERYSELQRADGSFGLWSKNSNEEHWLTAYATEFLYDLKAKGVAVPATMLDKATERLESYLSSRSRHQVQNWSSNPQHYDVAYRAYSAYVLAKQAKITLGPLRDIAEKDMFSAVGQLPGVHLGLAMLITGSEKEGINLINQALTQVRSDQYLGDYGSVLRDKAMVINALLTTVLVPDDIKQKALVMLPDLANEMQQQRWLSTQERSAILLLAMTMQSQYDNATWQGELNVDDHKKTLNKSGEYRENIPATNALQATFINRGENPVYASFEWMGVKKEAEYDLNHGIQIKSEYFLVKNNEATKLADNSTLKSGELLLSRITVRSNKRVPDALLVSLMPAGVELENQNLANSLKLADISVGGQQIATTANLKHQEFRDDRYVAAVDLPEQKVQTLYLLARAVNPGQYVFPAIRIESMYQPSVYGVGGSIKKINVEAKP